MKRFGWIVFFATLGFAQLDPKTNNQNMVRDRGQTNVFRDSHPITLSGTLIDAGCKDRSPENLTSPPETLNGAMPVATPAGTRAAKTKSQVHDLATRQVDPSCAVTGGTSAYALVMSDGRILNLDAAGNTLAAEVVTMSKQGRAMLNGQAYGFKPRVKVAGRVRGDRLMASDVVLQ